MAVDKLVDSTELDNGLTTIANAIRTKGGTSAQLSFPSGMAQAIADLPSGGSLPSSISKIDGGNFTFVTDKAGATKIDHNLGVEPKGFAIWTDDLGSVTPSNAAILSAFGMNYNWTDTGGTFYGYSAWQYKNTANASNITNGKANNSTSHSAMFSATQFSIGNALYHYYLHGIEYHWIAWA